MTYKQINEMAQALRCISDYLQVYFEFAASTTSVDENGVIERELLPETIQYFDVLGHRINESEISKHTMYLKVGNL